MKICLFTFCFFISIPFAFCKNLPEEATEPSSKTRPNILVFIADDWSHAHAGAYGCSWVNTPHVDALAKEGILFTRAFTPNPKCAPSRAILLTGRYSWQLEEAGNHWCFFPPKFGTFMERIAASGYRSGYTGKGWGPGIAKTSSGEPRQLTGKKFQEKTLQAPTSKIRDIDYAGNFIDFHSQAPQNQPWIFWCGTKEPHRAYEWQSSARFGKKPSDIDQVPAYWPDNEMIRTDMLDYAVEVEHVDSHLGRIVAHLKQTGEFENTLIVVTSDHGMPFPRVKGQLYNDSSQVPLIISWPQGIKNAGRSCAAFVNFTDLAPTFLDLAGIKNPAPIMQPLSGKSLRDVFQETQDARERQFALFGKERHDIGRPGDVGYPIRGIRQGNWLYLRNYEISRWPAGNPETGYLNCDASPTKTSILNLRRAGKETSFWQWSFGKRPKEELYDLSVDPHCLENLAQQEKHLERKNQLRAKMESQLTKQGDPRMLGNGEVFDQYPFANEKMKNFYHRYFTGEELRAGWVNETDFEPEEIPSQ